MTNYIITEKDTGCAHSCHISEFDADIVIPDGENTYQFLVVGSSQIEKQIIILRLLQELYQKKISNCTVQMIGITITKKMKAMLKLLSKENKITICK